MIKKETLLSYMPNYYRYSPQMNAIMKSSTMVLPDAENDLWKEFFSTYSTPNTEKLWFEELGVNNEEELKSKFKFQGLLNKKNLKELGYDVRESYKDMPEDGFIPSESGYLADGHEYNMLTSVIISEPDKLDEIKNIVSFVGLAGYQYMFETNLKNDVSNVVDTDSDNTRKLYLGVTLKDHINDDYVSGQKNGSITSKTENTFDVADALKESWFTPNTNMNSRNITFIEDFANDEKDNFVRHSENWVDINTDISTDENKLLLLKHDVNKDANYKAYDKVTNISFENVIVDIKSIDEQEEKVTMFIDEFKKLDNDIKLSNKNVLHLKDKIVQDGVKSVMIRKVASMSDFITLSTDEAIKHDIRKLFIPIYHNSAFEYDAKDTKTIIDSKFVKVDGEINSDVKKAIIVSDNVIADGNGENDWSKITAFSSTQVMFTDKVVSNSISNITLYN